MRREHRVSDRVFAHLYPHRRSTDPQSFTDHLNTNLVAEVRIETQRFYGGLETVEARYPGLNYTHSPHIKRLSYFPYHKKLFEAFDALALTDSEILSLCRWEGTLWARQRYEKDEGVRVVDTTGDEIGPWVPPEQRLPISSDEKKFVSANTQSVGGSTSSGSRRTSRRTTANFPNRRSIGSAATTATAAAATLAAAVSQTQSGASRVTIAQLLEQQIQRPQGSSVSEAQTQHYHQPEERGDIIMHETPTPSEEADRMFPPTAHGVASVLHQHRADTPVEMSGADGPIQSPATASSLSPSEVLQRMHALAILRARGETIPDASDPAFEQYLKETAESHGSVGGVSSVTLGEIHQLHQQQVAASVGEQAGTGAGAAAEGGMIGEVVGA